jgi:hypothetical protein
VKDGHPESVTSFCGICHRLFCGHRGLRYEDESFVQLAHFGPVETVSGEWARKRVLGILEPRHAELDRRSRAEFAFSEIELQHMEALAGTIATLQGMAPAGALEPSRGDVRFELATP